MFTVIMTHTPGKGDSKQHRKRKHSAAGYKGEFKNVPTDSAAGPEILKTQATYSTTTVKLYAKLKTSGCPFVNCTYS